MTSTKYYRGPMNDNYGYDPDLVTSDDPPLGSTDPWDELEALDWVDVDDVEDGDVIVDLYYDGALRAGGQETVNRTGPRIQRARDYLSTDGTDIIGECDAGTVYLDNAVVGYFVADDEELAELGRALEEGVEDAYSHWCAACGREATIVEVLAAGGRCDIEVVEVEGLDDQGLYEVVFTVRAGSEDSQYSVWGARPVDVAQRGLVPAGDAPDCWLSDDMAQDLGMALAIEIGQEAIASVRL